MSQHFSKYEMTCHDGTPYPIDRLDEDTNDGRTWGETRLAPLFAALEIIREAAGDLPITIDSGYRDEAYDQRLYDQSAHNGLVATPQGSQHPKGRAADIMHARLSPHDLHELIGDLLRAGKLPMVGGVGLYPTFVHVDVRPRPASGHVAQWGGSRLSNIA